MARKNIDIGIQGNDGTGDSIRESFNKVNQNFIELFSIFNQGDRISFTDLDDTPNALVSNQIIMSNAEGSALIGKTIVAGEGITIDNLDENELRIISTGSNIAYDVLPSLGGYLNGQRFSIGNISSPTQEVADSFNQVHGTSITADGLVITKGYADQRYLQSAGTPSNGVQVRVRSEPANILEYTLQITDWVNGYARVNQHGFNTGSNGVQFRYINDGSTPATGLLTNSVYFLGYRDNISEPENLLGVYTSYADAVNLTTDLRIVVNNSPVVSPQDRGAEVFQDAFYNENLLGNWVSNEALPRDSVVRRQGDKMTGPDPLYLYDHPGSLSTIGTPYGEDDLQAATKLYVDNSSFSSNANIFVSTSGDDLQLLSPVGKEGSSFSYSYASINAACQRALEIINDSVTEPGPYKQPITYGDYENTAYLASAVTGADSRRTLNIFSNGLGIDQSKFAENRDLREGSIIKGLRSGATGKVISYNGISGLNDVYSIELLRTITDPTSFQSDYSIASQKIIENKNFIVAETVAYIRSKYSTLVFDVEKCARDTRFIVDALSFDVRYGGNRRSIKAARAYWRGTASALPVEQRSQTVDGINYISLLLDKILDNVVIPAPTTIFELGKRSNITQTASGAIGESGSKSLVDRLVDGIVDVVISGISGSGIKLEFLNNEALEFGQPVPEVQMTIRVESGIYYEQLPIRVPSNVSIKGDEFRRTIIRPADGVSLSPWARLYFYRDSEFDGLRRSYQTNIGSATSSLVSGEYIITLSSGSTDGLEVDAFLKMVSGTGVFASNTVVTRIISSTAFAISKAPSANLINATVLGINPNNLALDNYKFGYHYLVDPTTANSSTKKNKDMDVFLLNDATILRNITCQGHGGFMCVLDPEGQIQTKSPYFQTCTSISGSINKQRFAGGMFVDGFSGNIAATITGKTSNTRLSISGMIFRAPKLPSTTIVNGVRYQINDVESYNQALGTAVFVLDTSTPYTGTVSAPVGITIETPGNRSMLGNDFTQVNDLGYGVVTTNNALSEIVSVFTYYNWTSYYSVNGGQIRSVAGSNAYGTYGLRSTGRDPNEIPDPVNLADNMIQAAKIFKRGALVGRNIAGDASIYIDYYQYAPFNISQIEIDHTPTRQSIVTGSMTLASGGLGYAIDNILTVQGGTSSVAAQIRVTSVNGSGAITAFELINEGVYSISPTNPLSVTGGSPSASATFNAVFLGPIETYEVNNVELTTVAGDNVSGLGNTPVIKLNLTTSLVNTGLVSNLVDGQLVTVKGLQNFRFTGVEEIKPVRPSTAVEFTSTAAVGSVYRTLAYGLSSPIGTPLSPNQAIITFNSGFEYINLKTRTDRISNSDYTGAVGRTMGSTIGDTRIAIDTILSQALINKLNTGRLIFYWAGKIHTIVSYVQENIGLSQSAYITIGQLAFGSGTLIASPAAGIAAAFTTSRVTNLFAGLSANEPAEITVSISTCRVTGHDFLDIGTGGFNNTNYPNNILGGPVSKPVQSNEVREETQGRVFYVSTDQNGIFRVGEFFTVDQGTGTVSLGSNTALGNLDGIGFKRGVVVKEFSTDSTMGDNADDAVPTEAAVRTYIDKRLGITHTGATVSSIDRIPVSGGFLPLNQSVPMTATLNVNGNRIINLSPNTTALTDAASIGYVNTTVSANSQMSVLSDVTFTQLATNDLLIYNGLDWINAAVAPAGDISISLANNVVSLNIKAGSIVNADISSTAAISQSKLDLVNSTANTSALAIKGIASFNNDNFDTLSGWVSIKTGGVTLSNIQTIGTKTVLANLTNGSASPSAVTTNSVVTDGINGAFTTNEIGARLLATRSAGLSATAVFTNIVGTAIAGTGTFTNIPVLGGTGYGARVNISYSSGNYTTITVVYGGGGYSTLDQLTIPGGMLGGTIANTITFRVGNASTNIDNTVYFGTSKVSNVPLSNSIVLSTSDNNLGYDGAGFNKIFATDFVGTLRGNVVGTVTGTSTISTNIAGGSTGSIPYQSAANATAFLSPGVTNSFLRSQGASQPPVWQEVTIPDGNAGSLSGTTLAVNVVNSSLTSVGTLTSLSVSGSSALTTLSVSGTSALTNITASGTTALASLSVSGLATHSVSNSISANGTAQNEAVLLTRSINVITSADNNNRGVRLPTALAGYRIIIKNTTTTTIRVYANNNAAINSLGNNNEYLLIENGSTEFYCTTSAVNNSGGQWFTLGA